MILINIVSVGGGGKSVLLSLFDGHPEINIVPIHDKFFFALRSRYDKSSHDFRPILRDLSKSGYINYKQLAADGKIEFFLSSNKLDVVDVPFDIDPFELERRFVEKLKTLDWDRVSITGAFYDAYIELLSLQRKKYLAFMGVDNFYKNFDFQLSCPDAKTIFVLRDPLSVVYTKLNRVLPHSKKLLYSKFRAASFLIRETIRVASFDARAVKLSERDSRCMCVRFENLMETKATAMSDIIQFLSIEDTSILKNPSILGVDLVKGKISYVSADNDNKKTQYSYAQKLIVKTLYQVVFYFVRQLSR